jgi:hypothetical protein
VANDAAGLPHIWVRDRASDRSFQRRGGGDPKVREVERRAHGRARKQELDDALDEQLKLRGEIDESLLEELRAIGVIVVLEGADPAFPLKVESLERMSSHRKQPKRPWWRLLSVTPAEGDRPERAMVWVSDEYRSKFVALFEQYLTEDTEKGNARNRELVANIGRIRHAVLEDLWQSDGDPDATGTHWWELWLAPGDEALELLRAFADGREIEIAERVLRLVDRSVAWVHGRWNALRELPFSAVPVTEIRWPEIADTVQDLSPEAQGELAEDLAERITPANDTQPVVCHLDTGVRRSHALLEGSLAADDVHSITDETGADARNHGTLMASLALLGPLDDLLLSNETIRLRHRLESVKILFDSLLEGHDPLAYGLVTAQAVSLPEAIAARRRVFCMPITAPPERAGQPSLWSASVDALASGVPIAASPDGIELLAAPDPNASRLFIISAGNVASNDFQDDYRAACDASVIEDPAHAWNALAVGAYTEMDAVPDDPSYTG